MRLFAELLPSPQIKSVDYEQLLDKSLKELELASRDFDAHMDKLGAIDKVYKQAKLNKLTNTAIASLEQYTDVHNKLIAYGPITAGNQQHISSAVAASMEEPFSLAVIGTVLVVKFGTWALAWATTKTIIITVGLIQTIVGLIGGTLYALAHYMAKSRKSLEKLRIDFNEAQSNDLLEDVVLRNVVFTKSHATNIYKASNFKTSMDAMLGMEKLITNYHSAEGKLSESQVVSLFSSIGYDLQEGKANLKDGYNPLVREGSSIIDAGWNSNRIATAISRSITMSKNAKVLHETSKTYKALASSYKAKEEEMKEVQEDLKKKKKVSKSAAAATDEEKTNDKQTSKEYKDDIVSDKESFRILKELVRVYAKESRSLVKSSIDLGRLTLTAV